MGADHLELLVKWNTSLTNLAKQSVTVKCRGWGSTFRFQDNDYMELLTSMGKPFHQNVVNCRSLLISPF
jgi:hypothetical protein